MIDLDRVRAAIAMLREAAPGCRVGIVSIHTDDHGEIADCQAAGLAVNVIDDHDCTWDAAQLNDGDGLVALVMGPVVPKIDEQPEVMH